MIICILRTINSKRQKEIGKMGKKMHAFTLAEVLITLAIIGVVAALTIPSVVHNYQKQETVTRLKKAYSSIIQATNLAVAKYGATESWEILDYKDTSNGGTQKFGENYLVPYLKLKKDCQTSTAGECAVNIYDTAGNRLSFDATWSRLLLTEGILIAYATYSNSTQKYANFFIDVNGGIKKPNILGKDVFHYIYYFDGYGLKNGKLLPANYSSDRTALKSNCKVSTWVSNTCAALIMLDGWEIKDDYPL